jgi:hypothetical protein
MADVTSQRPSASASPDGQPPFPVPDETSLERRFKAQFEACEQLLTVVWSERPTGSDIRERWQVVVASILGRAISTFRATLHLCRVGLPTQAFILVRPLFEDLIACLWAEAHKDVVVERIESKEAHSLLVEHRVMSGLTERTGNPVEPLPPVSRLAKRS